MDKGDPPLNSTTRVEITVLDINDNAPTFQATPYETFIKENAQHHEEVLTVNAIDDNDTNGIVNYQIISGGGNIFEIGSEYCKTICIWVREAE